MQRIPLEVYPFAGSLRVMAHFILRSENPKMFVPVKAIVDTGSPLTLLGTLDLKRMRVSQLQIKKLIGSHKSVNIGGGKITAKILEKATLTFGNEFSVEMPVEFPISSHEENPQPSLLGVDFMEKAGATLIFNPSKRKAYFEISS